MWIDDTNINAISEASLMDNITYVSHQNYLFKGLVRDNLLMVHMRMQQWFVECARWQNLSLS